jgi:hypothetical protein
MIELVIGLAVCLCVYLAALMYYSNASFIFKLIGLPAMSVFLIGIIYLLIVKAGAPINQFPKDNWNYVHHEIMDAGENIYIWTHYKEKGNRLYKIKYDREIAKKLQQAKNKTQSGIQQAGKFSKVGDISTYPSLHIADRSKLDGEDFHKPLE